MPRILIVDDEQELIKFLAEEFKDRALDVDTVLNGLEAVESVMAKSPDIVLLDVRMPGMDGIAALKKFKDINPVLKVVMMTAFQDEKIMEQARALGAIDYIKKPVSLACLDTVIMGKISSLLDPP